MSIADIRYKELIKDIYENGSWDFDKEVRAKYSDGTSAYCKSVFGKQIIFEEDELPLLTCKKMFPVTAIKEMYLFWIKQSIKKEDFDQVNCKIWDEWFLDDGTLGKSYAYQFESYSDKSIVEVKPRIINTQQINKSIIKINDLLKPNYTVKSKYIDKIQTSVGYGDYRILDYLDEYYTIQFLNTGYITKVNCSVISKQNIIKDPFSRDFFEIGYLGLEDFNISKEERDKHYRRWFYMLKRCYDPSDKDYHSYGARGIFVNESWHCFTTYVKDLFYLPQYFIAKKFNFTDWALDKDYFSSNCYSKETCVWLLSGENLVYRNNPISFFLIHPNGSKELFLSVKDAEKKYNLSCLDKVIRGERVQNRGFKTELTNFDLPLRYSLSKNQVVDLISNIKNNPASKRLMTSFWNFKDVNQKALQECAMQTTWHVRGDKLDLLLYSRSGDLGLGIPFNWFQYKILQILISHCTGYKAGRFIHQIGNLHYYDRHEQTLLNQLELKEFEEPDITLKTNSIDFFNLSFKDIEITNYQHGDYLPMEVAI